MDFCISWVLWLRGRINQLLVLLRIERRLRLLPCKKSSLKKTSKWEWDCKLHHRLLQKEKTDKSPMISSTSNADKGRKLCLSLLVLRKGRKLTLLRLTNGRKWKLYLLNQLKKISQLRALYRREISNSSKRKGCF